MDIDEAKLILGTLKAAYPKTFADLKKADANNMVMLWANMFADDDIKIVKSAVEAFISTDDKGFPPAIGQIKTRIANITGGVQKSELEAWADVKRALCHSLYNSKEEFEKLDPVIKRIVGSPSQLKEWAQAELSVFDTVIASNFQRSYKACEKNYRESLCLPSAVSGLIKELAAAKTLENAQERQKALPVSVEAIVNEAKAQIGKPPERPTHKPLTEEEFEKRRQELLKQIAEDNK